MGYHAKHLVPPIQYWLRMPISFLAMSVWVTWVEWLGNGALDLTPLPNVQQTSRSETDKP